MSRNALIIVVLVVLALLLLPLWPYSHAWGVGWYPLGGLILLVLVIVVLVFVARRG